MRLYNLYIENIGTFLQGSLEFISPEDNPEKPPVVVITGENGAGKTLILDAIREVFGKLYRQNNHYIRDIVREKGKSIIQLRLAYQNQTPIIFRCDSVYRYHKDGIDLHFFIVGENTMSVTDTEQYYSFTQMGHYNYPKPDWIVDYWTSKLSTDSFAVKGLVAPQPEKYLENALGGVHPNIEITQLICYFDYLRSSDSPQEKQLGEFLYSTLKQIIKLSLDKGELAYVKRATLEPIIKQGDLEITLDKLSSGNLYFVQRMVSLLGKMYAVGILQKKPIEEYCLTKGLLLIDEAENHLHPKWQKTFIQNVLSIFPNLQIILTTHSPFIVSSVENARVYVCEPQGDHSIIKDVTAEYSNKPIEEILISDVFGGTSAFNTEISDLLQARKEASKKKDKATKKKIEAQLLDINPQYFSFLQTEELLAKITQR